MRSLALCLALAATSAAAQDGLRDSDVRLSRAELTQYLSGHVFSFYAEGVATYRADSTYRFSYSADTPPFDGVYEVKDDSSVCVEFNNGFSRCDYIVQAGDRHVMIIFNGDRYPIKERVAIE